MWLSVRGKLYSLHYSVLTAAQTFGKYFSCTKAMGEGADLIYSKQKQI